ncbi:MAG: YggT family protein [Actinobacteria bacterium]|nr:YggT family protein [Actinomycetota bacterium]
MEIIGDILSWILLAYLVVVFARIIITWIPVKWPRRVRPVVVFIYDITEPLLSPLRRFIPMVPLGEGASLDLSPTVLILAIFFLRWLVGKIFG